MECLSLYIPHYLKSLQLILVHLQDNLPANQLVVSQDSDWSTRGLDNVPSQLAEKFDENFGVNNCFKHDFQKSDIGELASLQII